jgi:hypothetical protein
MTGGTPAAAALREPLERPRLLRMAIRAESIAAGGVDVAHGVVARVEGGYFVAGPPATPFHTVVLWAGSALTAVAVGCVPVDPDATVEVCGVHETDAAGGAEPVGNGAVEVRRYGGLVTLTCRDGSAEDTGMIVDLLWEDG